MVGLNFQYQKLKKDYSKISYVYIKDFNRLMFKKNKNKIKKWFCRGCLEYFSSEKVVKEHGIDCLIVNGGQNVKLEKGCIEFKNYSRHIPCSF